MSKNTVDLTANKSANTVVDVPCIECSRSTKHMVLASADIEGEDFYGFYSEMSVQYHIHHQIVQCQGCESISYRSVSTNSEDFEVFDGNHAEHIETVDLYPSRNEGRNPLKDIRLLPLPVQRIYEETIKAMNNDQPVLAGIGIRALVETICKDKKAASSNLFDKINDLVKIGVLTSDGAVILHQIRTLGNDAAHEVKPHKPEQLALALDVCEHLLQGTYILPAYAKKTFK